MTADALIIIPPIATPKAIVQLSTEASKRSDNLPGLLYGASGMGVALGLKGMCWGSLTAERKDLF